MGYGLRVIEVEGGRLLSATCSCCGGSRAVVLCGVVIVCPGVGSAFSFFLGFAFFLLLQLLDDAVDGCQVLFLRQLGQSLQAVLQLHGTEVGLDFAEHFAAALYLLVVIMLLVHDTCQLVVAVRGIDVVLLFPIEFSEVLKHYGLGEAVLCAFLDALFPCVDGMQGVAAGQVDIADGIVDAVEVVGIVRVLGHAAQLANHGLTLSVGHHLRL